MAEHTATLVKNYDDVWGSLRVKGYSINITAAGADGYTLSAALLGFKRIKEVICTGTQETMGYILQFIPTSVTLEGCGDGLLQVVQSDDAVDPLDEVTSGDLGVFRFLVLGY